MGRTVGFRESIDLDGAWTFSPDPGGRLTPTDLTGGEPIHVPGCWEAQSDAWRGLVTGWYRRPLDVPGQWRDSRVILAFGAVMYHATVFVNGTRVGEHEGGYTPFELDATDHVDWGGSNDLAVRVVNPMGGLRDYPASAADIAEADALTPAFPVSSVPHGKQTWYSSQSGIWQSVRVERRARPSLAPLRVRVELADPAARIRWSLDLGGAEPPTASTIELSVFDPDGAAAGGALVEPAGATDGEVRIAIPEPRLWDIGQPNLYRIDARLVVDGAVRDAVEAGFGMREIATRDGRILLNGRPIYLVGALDQDLYEDTMSTPPSRAMLDDQLHKAQQLGLNLLRCHIKVPDPAYLDAADEAGMLVWCELPNWLTFTPDAARRGRDTLQAVVEALGNHPSIAIWTIINEDWGTRVREEARDRAWLADTYAWLKALDPQRLVVDNSACDTAATPNFHVRSDLADFHVYHAAPDNAPRWRSRIEDFARRPSWLWSPFGDAQPRGDEPLVLSEFGSWGLPRLDAVYPADGAAPWWTGTGRDHLRPAGIRERFVEFGLDRVWPTVDDLAAATQWHQFETLQYEIGEMRRHDTIQGYVITELADAYWEANGLLDVRRATKAFHERSATINAQDVVVADISRRDFFPGDRLTATIHLSAYGDPSDGGEVTWELVGPDGVAIAASRGRLPVHAWPDGGARAVGELAIEIPRDVPSGAAFLVIRASDAGGRVRASDSIRVAILPAESRTTKAPRAVAVDDPFGIWGIDARVGELGHRVVARSGADLLVASDLGADVAAHVEAGGRALILVRSRSSIPEEHGLARPVSVRGRALPEPATPDHRNAWDGDWVTSWSWILPGAMPGVPDGNPLGFAHAEVMPDHVLAGYDPRHHREEVVAGMFVGWVHAPAALAWTFPQGAGSITLTTFRVAPERGPVATALLDGLIQLASGQAGSRPEAR